MPRNFIRPAPFRRQATTRGLLLGAGLALASITAANASTTGSGPSVDVGSLWGVVSQGSSIFVSDSSVLQGTSTFGTGATKVGASITTLSSVSATEIDFANGGAAEGPGMLMHSETTVVIRFTNMGSTAVTPKLNSTIIGAGIGLYVAPSGCRDNPAACGPDTTFQTASGVNFNSFKGQDVPLKVGTSTQYYPGGLAGAAFDFRVTNAEPTTIGIPSDPFNFTPQANDLYFAAGAVTLSNDPSGLQTGFNAAAQGLNGFHQDLVSSIGTQIGYNWDNTNFSVSYPTALLPGQSGVFTYQTSVTAYSAANCIDDTACLLSYAAFGDPVGRGGGALFNLGPIFGGVGGSDTGLTFPTFTFGLPTGTNGDISFTLTGVPEPGTWAMLLTGFGLMGLALRRSRRQRLSHA
jgi:hypothetical protein